MYLNKTFFLYLGLEVVGSQAIDPNNFSLLTFIPSKAFQAHCTNSKHLVCVVYLLVAYLVYYLVIFV